MKLNPELRRSYDILLLAIAAAEHGPAAADLTAAPVIDLWCPLQYNVRTVVLWGLVSGHPDLGRDYTTTSTLVALDPDLGWARTASRWYRLGVPFRDLTQGFPRARDAEFILPGFAPLEDESGVQEFLADYVMRVRLMDARDRAARGEPDDVAAEPPAERGRDERRVREQVLAGLDLVDAAEASELLRITDEPEAAMRALVLEKVVIALVHKGRIAYPRFQFDERNGQLHDVVRDILRVKPDRISDLRLAHWLTHAHVAFGGPPADRFGQEDAAVLDAFLREIEPILQG